jgi:hypothetical protein
LTDGPEEDRRTNACRRGPDGRAACGLRRRRFGRLLLHQQPGAAGPHGQRDPLTLAGSSWRFKGPNNTGTTLYAEDGTSLVEVDGKGTTKGKWMTKDGQLCESFDPAPGFRAACR